MSRSFGPSLLVGATACWVVVAGGVHAARAAKQRDPQVVRAVNRALDYLAREQRRQGFWEANGGQYRVAMTALAGLALAAEGSTTTQGKYAPNIRRAVDWLVEMADPRTGLIGYRKDYHYTYGHGFSMMFLSQIYGEEEDPQRREELRRVLTKAVKFSGEAQTSRGGWGYVSAKDGNDFDEGSTCVTQVQGLRACRNAGIPVPKEIIDRARKYIHDCTTPEGGVQYSIRGGGPRPPITAAAIASLFNAGAYDDENVKKMLAFCQKTLWPGSGQSNRFVGHWHYAHFYYAQVMYRIGGKDWERYFKWIKSELLSTQSANGAWKQGHVGPIYTTAISATILQLDNGFLPIFER